MRNIALRLRYDGSAYHGWQVQKSESTVAETLETALGRKTHHSAIGAFKAFGRKYAFIGFLASVVPFIITPYYCIIGGLVTKYAATFLTGG